MQGMSENLEPRLHLQSGREHFQPGREKNQPGRELIPPVYEHFLRAHIENLHHVIFSRVRRKLSHLRMVLRTGSTTKLLDAGLEL